MSSLIPLRRRRFGICSTRTLASGLCLFILFVTFLKLRVAHVDPAVGLDRDISQADEARLKSGHAAQQVQTVGDEPNKSTISDLAKGNKAALSAGQKRTAFVVASRMTENTTWLEQFFPDWEKSIYHVDEPLAALTVPKNKGRESMVYLTYVIMKGVMRAASVRFIAPFSFPQPC
jgi:hypothetical protein